MLGALYGYRKSSMLWQKWLMQILDDCGLRRCLAESTVLLLSLLQLVAFDPESVLDASETVKFEDGWTESSEDRLCQVCFGDLGYFHCDCDYCRKCFHLVTWGGLCRGYGRYICDWCWMYHIPCTGPQATTAIWNGVQISKEELAV